MKMKMKLKSFKSAPRKKGTNAPDSIVKNRW
jgi:hypothetical protein